MKFARAISTSSAGPPGACRAATPEHSSQLQVQKGWAAGRPLRYNSCWVGFHDGPDSHSLLPFLLISALQPHGGTSHPSTSFRACAAQRCCLAPSYTELCKAEDEHPWALAQSLSQLYMSCKLLALVGVQRLACLQLVQLAVQVVSTLVRDPCEAHPNICRYIVLLEHVDH